MHADQPAGWLFLSPDAVPDAWSARARPAMFVALLPEETARLLRDQSVAPALDERDEQVARLTARGRTVDAIARELGMSSRTVARRLAHLRGRFGAGSTTELASLLAGGGIGLAHTVPCDVKGGGGGGREPSNDARPGQEAP